MDECSKTDTIQVYQHEAPHVQILLPEKDICRSDTIHLRAEGDLIYRWHDGQDLLETGNDFYVYIFREQFVMLTGTDEYGCMATDTITLHSVVCCGAMYVPTGFTPNGDGLNDKFRVVTTAVFEHFDLMIRDRWGGEVFRTNDARHGWDGTRAGVPAGVGTYFYLLKAKCFEQDEPVVLKGDITLIR